MRRLLAETTFKMCPNGNVKHAVGTKSRLQFLDQVFLRIYDLACGAMAHEGNLLTVRHQFLDGPGKRIQTAREQNYPIRREPHIFITCKREVAFHGRWIFEETKFKLVIVV